MFIERLVFPVLAGRRACLHELINCSQINGLSLVHISVDS